MTRRLFSLAAICLLVMVVGAPAVQAASDGPLTLATAEEPEGTEVTEAPTGGPVPAVNAPAPSEEAEEQPWTARFLVPTVLALGALSVIVAGGYYLVRIRGRYRVV